MAIKRLIFSGLVICACIAPLSASADAAGETLIVIPARYTVVQFAFDVARLRPVYLVAHDTEGKAKTLALHVWDGRAREWVRIGLDEYRSGAIFRTAPKNVVIVGSDQDVPAAVSDVLGWAKGINRIPSMNIVDMINGMNKTLNFEPREWRYLARRYNLELEDRNEERRRYGRYGPPKGRDIEPEIEMPPEDDVVMPMTIEVIEAAPAVVSEEAEIDDAAPAPVEEKGEPVLEEETVPEKGMPEGKGAPAPAPVMEEKSMPEDIAPGDK